MFVVITIYSHIYISLCVDLGRMYNLVSRITDGLGELKKLLETHIYNQGLAAIEKCGEAALNVRTRVDKIVTFFAYFLPKGSHLYWIHLRHSLQFTWVILDFLVFIYFTTGSQNVCPDHLRRPQKV